MSAVYPRIGAPDRELAVAGENAPYDMDTIMVCQLINSGVDVGPLAVLRVTPNNELDILWQTLHDVYKDSPGYTPEAAIGHFIDSAVLRQVTPPPGQRVRPSEDRQKLEFAGVDWFPGQCHSNCKETAKKNGRYGADIGVMFNGVFFANHSVLYDSKTKRHVDPSLLSHNSVGYFLPLIMPL